VLVDGNATPRWQRPSRAIVDGDAKCRSIAAASIIAKVTRDRMMADFAADYPGYGWETNRGYGTPEHYRGLKALGLTPLHRRSFAPIRAIELGHAQPELELIEMHQGESFAPQSPAIESDPPDKTQHIVVGLPPITPI
jgi:ribonuclease HII